MSTTLNVSGTLSMGANAGTLDYAPPQIVNQNSVGSSQVVALSTSELAVAVPAGAEFFALVPPAANTVPIYVYGVASQSAGEISVHPTIGIPCMGIAPGQTAIYFKSGSPVNAELIFG